MKQFSFARIVALTSSIAIGVVSTSASATTFSCNASDAACVISALLSANDETVNPGTDVIALAAGTYSFTKYNNPQGDVAGGNALPSITSDIILRGADALTTIVERASGADPVRLFHVAAGARLTLEKVTLRNGDTRSVNGGGSGGAVHADGELIVRDSILENNRAAWSGGAVSSGSGLLRIERSTLRNNTAGDAANPGSGYGGAVSAGGGGTVRIANSSFYGNLAGFNGGALALSGNPRNSLRMFNTSVIDNSAGFAAPADNAFGGGIWAAEVSLGLIWHSTIAGNSASFGGGLTAVDRSQIELQNTLLAGNSASRSFADCQQNDPLSMPIGLLPGNIIGDLDGCFVSGEPVTDCAGKDASICPGLAVRANPATAGSQHRPLLRTSLAVDSGSELFGSNFIGIDATDEALLYTDQVNQLRTDGNHDNVYARDVGAIEYQGDSEDDPLPPSRFRFVVMADTRDPCKNVSGVSDPGCDSDDDWDGTNEHIFGQVIDEMVEATRSSPPAFVLFSGDLTRGETEGDHVIDVETALNDWRDFLADRLSNGNASLTDSHFYIAWGSHEWNSVDLSKNRPKRYSVFSNFFDAKKGALGNNACTYFDPDPFGTAHTAQSYGHTVYYCDYLNARFFVLNNDCNPVVGNPDDCIHSSVSHAQQQWVENLLTGPNRKQLNFFVQHEPSYGTGARSASLQVPDALDKRKGLRNSHMDILLCGGATMLFNAHEHQYSRRQIDANLLTAPVNRQGIVLMATIADANKLGPRLLL